MNNTNSSFKLGGLNLIFLAFFLLISPLTGAFAACCAGHGGVASCNKSTGYQMCKDKSASPTCKCTIPKSSTTTPLNTNSKTTKTIPPVKNTTTKPKTHWWSGKQTPATTAPTTGTGAKGCCSRHGGVAQCNTSTHHQMCKDGSESHSCTCQ